VIHEEHEAHEENNYFLYPEQKSFFCFVPFVIFVDKNK